MPLNLLDTPLRLTWEICPSGRASLSADDLMRIADRLVAAGVFFLQLEAQPLLHTEIMPLLERLKAGGCQPSLVLGDNPLEWDQIDKLNNRYPLFVDAGPWLAKKEGLQRLETQLEQLTAKGQSASLLWVPAAGQLSCLYALLEICERRNVSRFKLPNRKIDVNPEPFETARLLRPRDLDELARMLVERPLRTDKTLLEVHDLFLWELLFPRGGGERSEYGGCQAGNSLGHIIPSGDVWPCSSWPQPLGNLLQQDLEAIWESSARHQVRTEVSGVPPDCTDCLRYMTCFGGCRGLARSCRQNGDRRDLLCHGPQSK